MKDTNLELNINLNPFVRNSSVLFKLFLAIAFALSSFSLKLLIKYCSILFRLKNSSLSLLSNIVLSLIRRHSKTIFS